MSKARVLADFISDGSEFADGAISVSEVSGAAPLASPTFTGTAQSPRLIITDDSSNSPLLLIKQDDAAPWAFQIQNDTYYGGDTYGFRGYMENGGAFQWQHKTSNFATVSFKASNSATTLSAWEYNGGFGSVFNQDGDASMDFRVESDTNTHALFLNGANGYFGLGESSPQSFLHVSGSGSNGWLYLNNTSPTADHVMYFRRQNSNVAYLGLLSTDQYWLNGSAASKVVLQQKAATELVINESSVDADFRVESDNNTHMLFVDASNNSIGINTGVAYGTAQTVAVGNTKAEFNATQWSNFSGAQDGSGMFAHNLYRWHDGSSTRTSYTNTHANIGGAGVLVGAGWNTGKLVATNSAATAGAEATNLKTQLTWQTDQVIVNDDGDANIDFRVESDTNANAFVVDAATSIVRIGAPSDVANNAQPKLSITTPWKASSSSDYDGTLSLVATGGGASGGRGPNIIFTGEDGASARTLAKIDAIKENSTSGDHDGALIFRTRKNASGLPARLHLMSYAAIFNDDSDDTDFIVESNNSSHMLFVDAGDDRVFIAGQTDGNSALNPSVLHVGPYAGRNGIKVETNSSANFVAFSGKGGNTDWYYGHMVNPSNVTVGSIICNNTSTSYNTSSDYRLKENVVELTGATERLKQLKPSRFNFITDPDKTVDGFLAHEVQAVVPEAIHGVKDDVDAEGNPVYQGIDQSKLVPLLVATIKELEARITALENA